MKKTNKLSIGILVSIAVVLTLVVLAKYTDTKDKETFLQRYELDTMTMEERIEFLDGSSIKPEGLQAQITPTKLELTDGKRTLSFEAGTEKFYLSFAPYISETHPCFNHVPTGCQGELAMRDFEVTVKDLQGNTLYEGKKTTAKNGFAGIWLPRDVEGTIEVRYEGRVALSDFSTSDQSGTCLTTLQLV